MALEILEREADFPRKPSLPDRLWLVMRRVLRLLTPHIVIPGRCRYCWVGLRLIQEQIAEYEGGYLVRHDRYWECPRCADRTAEPSVYLRDPDIWSHC